MPLIILLLLFIYKVYIYLLQIFRIVYISCVAWWNQIICGCHSRSEVFDVPRLDSKEGHVYSEVLVLVYERWLEPSWYIICNLIWVRQLDCLD